MSVIIEFVTDIIKQTAGQTAGILLALSPLLSSHIRDIIAKKIQLSFDKALEDKKSSNERKNYISQARFDVEFETYRKLSKAYFNMVKCISELIPDTIPEIRTKEYKDKLHKDSYKAVVDAQDILHENAPFISKELFNEYEEILNLCDKQIEAFSNKDNVYCSANSENKTEFMIENGERTIEIKSKFNILNENVREYLSSLDVL